MSDKDLEDVRLKVVKELSSNYDLRNKDDKPYIAMINLSSKVAISILKELNLLNP